jgi:hypothetical protein
LRAVDVPKENAVTRSDPPIDFSDPPLTLSTTETAALTGNARGTLWAAARDGGGIVVGDDEVIRPIKVGRSYRWPTTPILDALGVSRRSDVVPPGLDGEMAQMSGAHLGEAV